MFPKISDLINYLLGTSIHLPFQTYGFMLAVAFLLGGWVMRSELKRKEKEGLLATRNRKGETIHPYQNTWSILVVALVAAIVGSKIFDILDNLESFMRDPIRSLFSFNGFSFYGGLIATVPALILYMRVLRLDWKQVIDCSAPGILIGYAVGRLGCHLSGDGCWGVPNILPQPQWLSWLPEWTWASNYPHNVINQGIPISGCEGPHCSMLAVPVFPTSFYESVLSLLIFGLLWLVRKHIKAPVVLFGLFLLLFGIQRLLIEQIRINIRHSFFSLQVTQAEIISVALILTGILTVIYFRMRKSRKTNAI